MPARPILHVIMWFKFLIDFRKIRQEKVLTSLEM